MHQFKLSLKKYSFLTNKKNPRALIFSRREYPHPEEMFYQNIFIYFLSNSTVLEWTRETTKNIGLCKQEIKCCMSLRSYVEILFKQTVEDISNQFNRTNEQFRCRMEEIRYAKMKLEGLHCGTANQVLKLQIDSQ
jgi:hypothetical protein